MGIISYVQYLIHDDTERSSGTNGTAGLFDCAFPKGMMGATTAMVALEARIARTEVVIQVEFEAEGSRNVDAFAQVRTWDRLTADNDVQPRYVVCTIKYSAEEAADAVDKIAFLYSKMRVKGSLFSDSVDNIMQIGLLYDNDMIQAL